MAVLVRCAKENRTDFPAPEARLLGLVRFLNVLTKNQWSGPKEFGRGLWKNTGFGNLWCCERGLNSRPHPYQGLRHVPITFSFSLG